MSKKDYFFFFLIVFFFLGIDSPPLKSEINYLVKKLCIFTPRRLYIIIIQKNIKSIQ